MSDPGAVPQPTMKGYPLIRYPPNSPRRRFDVYDEQPGQATQGGNHPTRPEIARSTSNYTIQFPEDFNLPSLAQQLGKTDRQVQDHVERGIASMNPSPSFPAQQRGETGRQLQDRLGRGPATTNPSFTRQLADVENLSKPAQRPFPSTIERTNMFRPAFSSLRDITPAGDFPVHVEKRTARRALDPAVWEIDEGLKMLWLAHLDGQRKGSS